MKGPRASLEVAAALLLLQLCACSPALQLDALLARVAERDPEILYYVRTDASAIALTIDDGPDPQTTPPILDLLAEHGARATFFLITSRIPGNEDLLRRMIAEGHELANHSTRDHPSDDLEPARFERDLLEAQAALSPWTSSRWFRPGSGAYDDEVLATLERHGYRCVLGSVYPFDPQLRWSWLAQRYIVWRSRPGSILILHDGPSYGARTLETLRGVLPALGRGGLRVLTLSELVDAAG
jgi:peptidoglycan/xylan/chitin deacetylase (PgdA/CDA1 family)